MSRGSDLRSPMSYLCRFPSKLCLRLANSGPELDSLQSDGFLAMFHAHNGELMKETVNVESMRTDYVK